MGSWSSQANGLLREADNAVLNGFYPILVQNSAWIYLALVVLRFVTLYAKPSSLEKPF
jgi:hypothetical protein